MTHIYSWIRDLPDKRDLKFTTKKYGSVVKLPPSVDLRSKCSKIEDQADLGSCTAQASVACLEYLEKIHNRRFSDLSRLFVYYNTRIIENTVKIDSGASLRDTMKSLSKYGVCAESDWPYIISRFSQRPKDKCYTDGKTHVITSYKSLKTLTDMKSCLAQGYPFVFGASIYESFESESTEKTGIVKMPGKREGLLGGHALCCVGYQDSKQWFIVRNSWGSEWGDRGYCYMPYSYLENIDLADDFWTVRTARGF